jgi:hypothetical protein
VAVGWGARGAGALEPGVLDIARALGDGDGVVLAGGAAVDAGGGALGAGAGPGRAVVLVAGGACGSGACGSGARAVRRPVRRGRREAARGRAEGVRAGASPCATDSGSAERPIRWPASRLAAQATAAVATIPSSAAAVHAIVRRFMVVPPYPGAR